MSSGVATWIGAAVVAVLLVAVVVWALVRHRRSSRREDWVALESVDVDELDRDDDRIDRVDVGVGEHDEEADRDPNATTAHPAQAVLPDAVLDADGDLRANDEIAVVIDANGIVVALTKPARRRLDGDAGVAYTELARIRPVAGADEFDAAHHPISRALEGEEVDRSPCVVETASSTLAGVISSRPVMVEADELVLVFFEVASAG
jgi:hypothetical protein